MSPGFRGEQHCEKSGALSEPSIVQKCAKQLLMRVPEKYGRRACGHLGCEQLLAVQRLRTLSLIHI